MPTLKSIVSLTSLAFLVLLPTARGQKPPLTLDEFFNAVSFQSVRISPDGHDVVVETRRADWSADRFRDDLWLYRDKSGGSLVQLTQSGHDSSPQWSPDGRWIAFLSSREKNVAQVYVLFASGSEAFPVTSGDEGIHAFAWSADSRRLYFATRSPWTKAQKDADTEEWKDVIRFREAERGDTLFSVEPASLSSKNPIARHTAVTVPKKIADLPYGISQMAVSPDGHLLALATDSPYGIFVADLPEGPLHPAIHTKAGVYDIHWAWDSRHIFLVYWHGTPEGPYQDSQVRLYWVYVAGGAAVRWAPSFTGEIFMSHDWGASDVMQNGAVFAAGRWGTEVQPYTESSPDAEFVKRPAWAGTYETFSAARHSPRVAFVYSSLQRPMEVYLAESPERLQQAKPITAFNQLFTERELPQGKPYRWTADDGTPVEGMLIYPPGHFEANHLPMLTLIPSGDSAAGNRFEGEDLSWQWAALAATKGWLVFEPNCRGSSGYGDAFASGYFPHVVSRPGKDILEGVDALVKDGIADPDQLTVGGAHYGGELTNWLITQTTRFRAAVSYGGGVEWVVHWGTWPWPTFLYLGGAPWETEANYNAEAAIWQMGKVTTPTHIVTVTDEARALAPEAYLLERVLQARGVPHRLLILPDENHSLAKNPWHGKIKVREELKWLEKYGKKSP